MTTRSHHQLRAWKEAVGVVKEVYRVTGAIPREELCGLALQPRRCAVSVPSNIGEGAARGSSKEFPHCLTMARGSLSELDTQLVIARELGYLDDATVAKQLEETFALLGGLINSVRPETKASPRRNERPT